MSSNTLTINKLKTIFEDLANRHMMVNDFGFGPAYNIGAERPMNYPFLWIEPVSSRVQSGAGNSQGVEFYTFNMYVLDKINKGDENFTETTSVS